MFVINSPLTKTGFQRAENLLFNKIFFFDFLLNAYFSRINDRDHGHLRAGGRRHGRLSNGYGNGRHDYRG